MKIYIIREESRYEQTITNVEVWTKHEDSAIERASELAKGKDPQAFRLSVEAWDATPAKQGKVGKTIYTSSEWKDEPKEGTQLGLKPQQPEPKQPVQKPTSNPFGPKPTTDHPAPNGWKPIGPAKFEETPPEFLALFQNHEEDEQ